MVDALRLSTLPCCSAALRKPRRRAFAGTMAAKSAATTRTMRLSEAQRRAIVAETARIFGPDATVRLFGSRTDDAARGGDIDLHVEATGDGAELLDRELKLYAGLIRRLGDRRIDIVVHSRGAAQRSIDLQAVRTGIVL
jgi:predicted nucleotidyltransferase